VKRGEMMINIDGISDKRILVVDDEKEILELMTTVLSKEGFENIYSVSEGQRAVELCRNINPHIIILDIMLPDIDGYEVCRKIRAFSYAPIIFLSAKSDDFDKLMGLGIGADDYVTKPFSPKEVAFRVKAQLRRNQYQKQQENGQNMGNRIVAFGDIEVNLNKSIVTKSGEIVNLTAKEYHVLSYMALNSNQILSKNKICDAVWGCEYVGNDNAIMVHIRHLRTKIETDPSKPVYIKTVKGLGYKLITKGT